MHRRARLFTATFALLVTACGSGGDRRFDVVMVGDPESALAKNPPLTPAARLLWEATGNGLVGLDSEGRIRPDLAARWIVTDDGLSYIFRIEPSVAPVGSEPGTATENPLTAQQVRRALRAAIGKVKGTGLGRDLDVIDGIYARTNQVIEIRLKTAMPEFLNLLAAPELALRFAGQDQRALSLEADGPHLTLQQRALATGEAGSSLDIRIASAKEAVDRFQDGEAEMLLGGDIDALPHVKMGGLLRGTIRLDPVSGLFGLAVAKGGGFLGAAENRAALSMAIDRSALIEPFKIGGWTPRTRLVPVGPPGTPQPPGRWSALTMEERQAMASRRVAAWTASHGEIDPITIALPAGNGGELLFRGLSANLNAIGLKARRVGPGEKAQLRLIDQAANLDGPEWYFHRLDCQVIRTICSEEADTMVAEAIAEPGGARRSALLAEAETLLTATEGFISFGPPIRFSLVRGGIDGFAVNRWGFHPLSQLFPDPT